MAMSAEEKTEERQQGDTPNVQLEHVTEPPDEDQKLTEKPEVTEEHKEKAKEMAEAYKTENLQTTTLPGSSGTVSGTSVTNWVDDEDKGKIETSADIGNVEYRNTEEFKKKLEG